MYNVEWEEKNINQQRTFATLEEAEEYKESIEADAEILEFEITPASIRLTY